MLKSTLLALISCMALPLAAAEQEASGLPLEPARTISFETSRATWLSLDVAPDGATLVL